MTLVNLAGIYLDFRATIETMKNAGNQIRFRILNDESKEIQSHNHNYSYANFRWMLELAIGYKLCGPYLCQQDEYYGYFFLLAVNAETNKNTTELTANHYAWRWLPEEYY